MKLPKFILSLLAMTLAAGCSQSQLATTPSPDPSTPGASSNDGLSSVIDISNDVPADAISNNEAVQADVRTNLNAIYNGDVETVLGFTHPKVIEMMGGQTEAKAVLKTALSKTQTMGMALESLAFPDDSTFLKTDMNHFVIVPTKSIITANGQRVESLNYQFGIRAIGTSKWTYIEGSRINNQNVKTLFPDFPPDFHFPAFYRKKLFGSPAAAEKEPVGPVSNGAYPTSPQRDSEEIVFNLSVTEPLVGHVVATRQLQRQGLEALESRIEWLIRIEPVDEGLRITSRNPKVSPLLARLPEDALNQLLIGRMFLPSGVLGYDGIFRAAEGTAESVTFLHDSLSTASVSLIQSKEIDQFLNNALSQKIIETTCREHWKTMVQSFIGKTLQLGETYETEAVTDMPVGGSVVFVSKLKVVSQQPCTADQSQQKCVRIEWHSEPKGSLMEVLQNSATTFLPAGVSIESFDMTIDMVQVVNPSTLIPHSLRITKTTKADMRLPNGVIAPTREISTENWQYFWEDNLHRSETPTQKQHFPN